MVLSTKLPVLVPLYNIIIFHWFGGGTGLSSPGFSPAPPPLWYSSWYRMTYLKWKLNDAFNVNSYASHKILFFFNLNLPLGENPRETGYRIIVMVQSYLYSKTKVISKQCWWTPTFEQKLLPLIIKAVEYLTINRIFVFVFNLCLITQTKIKLCT